MVNWTLCEKLHPEFTVEEIEGEDPVCQLGPATPHQTRPAKWFLPAFGQGLVGRMQNSDPDFTWAYKDFVWNVIKDALADQRNLRTDYDEDIEILSWDGEAHEILLVLHPFVEAEDRYLVISLPQPRLWEIP
jgi:hypothetical protein